MSSLLDRFRSAWQRIFFWQAPPAEGSGEFVPHHHHADHDLVLALRPKKRVPRWKQLRFINRVLTPTERRLFWGAFLVALVAFVVGVGDSIRSRTELVPAPGGTFTEALVGTPKLINPLFAQANDVDRDLVTLVFSGLFRLDGELQAIPDLVEAYQWLDDDKTLEVRLRADARFHDGHPLTSDDVWFTYQAAKDPAWRSAQLATFRDVTVIRVDEYTLQFQLPQANPLFLNDLTLGILPAHIWSEIAPANAHLADANLKPVGSGPYRATSYTRDGRGAILHFHLSRFSGYYGLRPFIEEIRFRFYPDKAGAIQAIANGQADAVGFIPWSEAGRLRADQFRTLSLDLPQQTIAFFNTRDQLLRDEKLRLALSLAVDPAELSALVGDRAKPVNSPFPFLNDASSTTPDLERSRAMLDELGWKMTEGENVRRRASGTASTSTPGTPLEITIDVSSQPDLVLVAEQLQRRWSLVGAQVVVRRSEDDASVLRDALAQRSYQVIVWNLLIPPDQDLTRVWGSAFAGVSRGLNLSNLADRDVDAALDRAKHATSTDAIAEARLAVSRAVKQRVPALFLFRPSEAYVVSSRVKGVDHMRISRPSDRFGDIANWYLRSRRRWQ